jgi:predicted nucleic acid-binding OB-fold protein
MGRSLLKLLVTHQVFIGFLILESFVNVNRMTYEELLQFDGIGESLATNIIKERNGSHFKNEEDLIIRIKNLAKGLTYEF